MSLAGADRSPEGSTYIRAGGGAPVSTPKVVGVLVWLLVAALLGLAVYLAALAARQDSRASQLREHGVPVDIVVTGCRGISSGVGMGIEYWQCRGSFVLEGRGYEAVLINGSRALIQPGEHLKGIDVPGRPDLLSTASSVRSAHGSGTEYGEAAALAAAGLSLGAARVVVVRRRSAGS